MHEAISASSFAVPAYGTTDLRNQWKLGAVAEGREV